MVQSILHHTYMCTNMCVCVLASLGCVFGMTDGAEAREIAAGTGPKRQRNHLDELPHILSRLSVPLHARNGVAGRREREREKEKRKRRVSPENCGPSGPSHDLRWVREFC